jgi:hypothetical protein
LDHDPQIKRESRASAVKGIQRQLLAFVQQGIAVDLGPARDSRPAKGANPQKLLRALIEHLIWQRAGANKAHSAEKDQDELGKFVQPVTAQTPPKGRHPCLVRQGSSLGLGPHGAELEELEGLAVQAPPALAKQHRTADVDRDQDDKDSHKGRGREQQKTVWSADDR